MVEDEREKYRNNWTGGSIGRYREGRCGNNTDLTLSMVATTELDD